MKKLNLIFRSCGFTLIELIAVIIIITIAAMIAVPMLGSSAGTQIRSAADLITSDLEYAKSMAISTQRTHTVIFDESAESYKITDANGVIPHPLTNKDYVISFKADKSLSRVDIVDADFGSAEQVSFNHLGSPDNGGSVTLSAGTKNMTVSVEAVTGFISISP